MESGGVAPRRSVDEGGIILQTTTRSSGISAGPFDTQTHTHHEAAACHHGRQSPAAVSTSLQRSHTGDRENKPRNNGPHILLACESLRHFARGSAHLEQKTWLHGKATNSRLLSQQVGQMKPPCPRTSCTRFFLSSSSGPNTPGKSAMSSLDRLDQSWSNFALTAILALRKSR